MSGSRFRAMVGDGGVIQAISVADAGQAMIVEDVGFPALFLSGSAANLTRGYPDGTLTMTEIAARLYEISSRVSIPVIADGDDGFGHIDKVVRTVREFERAGAAAVTLEDLETKKRGLPIPVDEMVQRLHAALDARRDESFSIIARTDASAPWRSGLRDDVSGCENDAFERCAAYAEAGADLVMPQVLSANWVEKFGNQITAPILFRGGPAIGGASDLDPRTGPPPSLEELESWNVKVLAYTPALLFRAFSYYRRQLAECLEAGGFVSSPSDDADRIEAQSVALKMA